MTAPSTKTHGHSSALSYLFMIGTAVGGFLLIRHRGQALEDAAQVSAAPSAAVHGGTNTLLHVLLALAVVIVTARVVGAVFRALKQPPVVGEVLAGILLGPSMLGRVAPEVSNYVLPPQVAPFLGVLSQVGVILYMFLVGLELDTGVLRKRGHATVAISHASILAPFLLGAGLALYLYPLPNVSLPGVRFTVFALFVGVALSVTAFPVLARILTDRKLHKTRLGTIALACAAADDVTAWCLLAFVVSVAQAQFVGAVTTTALTLGFIAFMFVVVRPGIVKLVEKFDRGQRLSQSMTAVIFVAVLLSALVTEYIGIHAIFGAFLLGTIIPHESSVARDLTERLEDVVAVLLLPAFFAFTGMRTEIGLVSGQEQWILCAMIVGLASLGKFGGSFVAARLTGLGWRDSAAIGVLMNTRGLMELIVLNLGLDLKLISPALFAMMIIMALVTTMLTTPILHVLTLGHDWSKDPEEKTPTPEPFLADA